MAFRNGECLVDSRVKVRWPNYYSSFYGIVISQCHSEKNLGKETTTPHHASSHKHQYRYSHDSRRSKMVNMGRYFNEMILHCEIKAWSPKTEAWCKFVVSSYNSSLKKHLVTFASGATEMLELSRGSKQPAIENLQNQELERNKKQGKLAGNYPPVACKRIIPDPFCDAGPTQNDVSDHYTHASKKYKVTCPGGGTGRLLLKISRASKRQATQNLQNHECEGSTKQEQPAAKSDVYQACERRIPAPLYVTQDDVADRHMHVSKKSKGQSLNPVFPGTSSPVTNCSKSKDDKEQTPKNTTPPPNPVTSIGERSNETVDINGYKVKATFAPILEAIFKKYGDIANNCLFKSKAVRASLLEVVCDVVSNLQNYYSDIISRNLETIQNEISDVEAAKIDVSWLNQHLSKLKEASGFHKENMLLKKSKKNAGPVITEASEILKRKRLDLLLAQKRVKEVTEYMDVMNLVGRKIDDDILTSENEEYFWRRRLGGLLEPDERFDMYH